MNVTLLKLYTVNSAGTVFQMMFAELLTLSTDETRSNELHMPRDRTVSRSTFENLNVQSKTRGQKTKIGKRKFFSTDLVRHQVGMDSIGK